MDRGLTLRSNRRATAVRRCTRLSSNVRRRSLAVRTRCQRVAVSETAEICCRRGVSPSGTTYGRTHSGSFVHPRGDSRREREARFRGIGRIDEGYLTIQTLTGACPKYKVPKPGDFRAAAEERLNALADFIVPLELTLEHHNRALARVNEHRPPQKRESSIVTVSCESRFSKRTMVRQSWCRQTRTSLRRAPAGSRWPGSLKRSVADGFRCT